MTTKREQELQAYLKEQGSDLFLWGLSAMAGMAGLVGVTAGITYVLGKYTMDSMIFLLAFMGIIDAVIVLPMSLCYLSVRHSVKKAIMWERARVD